MLIRVIAIEDHPLMLKAIRDELSNDPEIQLVGELSHGSELAKMVYEKNPDVLILDLSLTGETFEPLTAVRDLTNIHPNLRILVLTGFDDPQLMRSLIDAGANGYILKSDNLSMQLPMAVKTVFAGGTFYSDQVKKKLSNGGHPATTQRSGAVHLATGCPGSHQRCDCDCHERFRKANPQYSFRHLRQARCSRRKRG